MSLHAHHVSTRSTTVVSLTGAPELTVDVEAGTLAPATFVPTSLQFWTSSTEGDLRRIDRLVLTGREPRKGSLYQVSAVYEHLDRGPLMGVAPLDQAPPWALKLAHEWSLR